MLTVGNRVDREDGRFYIPILHKDRIVCRVASDAFNEDENAASTFAMALAEAYNSFSVE